MADDDAKLVALIDNELDEASRSRLLARLADDEALRARYDALRKGRADLAAAFDNLLERAPLDRLRAGLPRDEASPPARPRFRGFALREFAAGLVVGLLAAGAAAWIALSLSPSGEEADWRSAIEEYVNLYTNETFSPLHPDPALQAAELSAVGARVGAHLTPENVALPGLRFTVAFMLNFKGAPLGAIAYVDARGEPVMLCVKANQSPNAPISVEQRGDLSLASWSREGRGYLLIGRISEAKVADLARMLESRV